MFNINHFLILFNNKNFELLFSILIKIKHIDRINILIQLYNNDKILFYDFEKNFLLKKKNFYIDIKILIEINSFSLENENIFSIKYNDLYFPFYKIIKTDKLTIHNNNDKIIFYDFERIKIDKKENPFLLSYLVTNLNNDIIIKNKIDLINNINFNWKNNLIIWIDDLFSIIKNFEQKNIFCIAHNFSGFDGFFILNILPLLNNKYKYNIIIEKNKIFCIKIINEDFTIYFTCRYLLLTRSLESLAKSYKIDFYKFDIDWNLVNFEMIYINKKDLFDYLKNNNFNYLELEKIINNNKLENYYEFLCFYCDLDVCVLAKCYISFLKSFKEEFGILISLKNFITASSLRINVFLNGVDKNNEKYFNNDIININYDNKIYKLLDKSYFGGRNEIFMGWTSNNIKMIDISGIYSKIITINELPIDLGYNFVCKNLKNKEYIDNFINFIKKNNYCCFIDCTVIIPKSNIGPLPIKINEDKIRTSLKFGYNYVSECYFSFELFNRIKYGVEIVEIYEIIIFKKGSCLNKYSINNIIIKDHYNNLGDKSIKNYYKLMNNSIYGKMARKNYESEWKIIKFEEIKNINNTFYYIESIDNNYILTELYKKSKFEKINRKNNKALGSSITSIGRTLLLENIKNLEKNNFVVIYCDTDSIAFTCDNNFDLINKQEFIWNFYGYDINWTEEILNNKSLFLGPKIYIKVYNDGTYNIKIKGCNDKSITIEDFTSLKNNENFLYTKNKNLSHNGLILEFIILDKKFNCISRKKRAYLYDENKLWNGKTEILSNFQKNRYTDFKKYYKKLEFKINNSDNIINISENILKSFNNFCINKENSIDINNKSFIIIKEKIDLVNYVEWDYSFYNIKSIDYLVNTLELSFDLILEHWKKNDNIVKIGVIINFGYDINKSIIPFWCDVENINKTDKKQFVVDIINQIEYFIEIYSFKIDGKDNKISDNLKIIYRYFETKRLNFKSSI